MIPHIDAKALSARAPEALSATRHGAEEVGFLTLHNTALDAEQVHAALDAYRAFFKGDAANKQAVNMDVTGSNRGWGGAGSEQVDPQANPDYKEVFDCGVELPADDPFARLPVYAPNQWPREPAGFQTTIETYFAQARAISLKLLQGISAAIGADPTFFADKFTKPMALLRGNYYPERPAWAGDRDFGIAAHTDYGCLTLLATDGQPGLEVQLRDGTWAPVQADPGTFIINFGEMLEMWTGGQVRATPHRVIGGAQERLSIPLFFNPAFDTNVAPPEAPPIEAGEHLSRRYMETYSHLQDGS
ncbi:isopenicillin N synthase family dioxygenase [Gymnodinialimonas ceratoperidinii]|uniref:2-oxoglutarate-dependent ethylene/succinate-forming enzyme n=1 Tax=Gymnodinialimonas ceratoperidinii TaxID=2856823 RepID=A0A8F6YBT1_9RHOB|nr:2-oxoglutarate and iron-dependent oxygenase domain-containing protein [Gymnodinialimonas ceratoperidinii]QXT38530.1 isopenicillin N synthase family oxygenase [Gymnodinialimonas ceratoperidinii]